MARKKKSKRGKRSAWTSFVAKHRRRGLSMKQVARLWRSRKSGSTSKRGKRGGYRKSGYRKSSKKRAHRGFKLHAGHGLSKAQAKRLRKLYAQMKSGKRAGNRKKVSKAAKAILALKESVASHYASTLGGGDYAAHREMSESSKYNDPGRRRRSKKKGKRKGKARRKSSAWLKFIRRHRGKGHSLKKLARMYRKKHASRRRRF